MEGSIRLENKDFALEIKNWTKKTIELGRLAQDIIRQEIKSCITEQQCKRCVSEKVKESHSSVALERKPNGKFIPMFPKQDLIIKHGRIPIYKPIVEYILKESKEEMKIIDISEKIKEIYEKKLKKKLTDGTCKTYAVAYATIMVKRNELTRMNRLRFKVNKTKEIEVEKEMEVEEEKEDLAKEIYRVALRENWIGKKNIQIKTIADKLKVSEDVIKIALVELFKTNKAAQQSNEMVRF